MVKSIENNSDLINKTLMVFDENKVNEYVDIWAVRINTVKVLLIY